MRHLSLFLVFLVMFTSSAMSQDLIYPDWIAPRYCADHTDKQTCTASLTVNDLYGLTDGTAQAADKDNDGEAGQWGQNATSPRLARCKYSHPSHTNWNFEDDCFFTNHQRFSAFLVQWIRVGTKNGNSFNLETLKEHGRPDRHTISTSDADLPARISRKFGHDCFEAIKTGEIFCVIPTEIAQVPISETELEGSVNTPETSHCLEFSIEEFEGHSPKFGLCQTSELCEIGEDSGESSCETVHRWDNGAVTTTTSVEEWYSLDNKSAIWLNEECLYSSEDSVVFCSDQKPYDTESLSDMRLMEERCWVLDSNRLEKSSNRCRRSSTDCLKLGIPNNSFPFGCLTFTWPDGETTFIQSDSGGVQSATKINGRNALNSSLERVGDAYRDCTTNSASRNTFCHAEAWPVEIILKDGFFQTQEPVVTDVPVSPFTILLDELPELKKWAETPERPQSEIDTLLEVISKHRKQEGLTALLDDPSVKSIDLLAAVFATASYWPSKVVRELFEHEGFTTVYTDIDFSTKDEDSMMFEYTNTEGRSYKFWVITGSESWSDWKRNISTQMSLVPPISANGVQVKLKGKVLTKQYDFSQTVFDLGFVILRTNSTFDFENTTFVVVGHSQGGMAAGILASMLFEYIEEKGTSSDLQLVTFANPGSADKNFSEYYSSQYLSRNFINTADLVPHLHNESFATVIEIRELIGKYGLDIFLDQPNAWRIGSDIKFENDISSWPILKVLGVPLKLGEGLVADHQMSFSYLLEASRRLDD